MKTFTKTTLAVALLMAAASWAHAYDIPEANHTIPNTVADIPFKLTNGVMSATLTPEKPQEVVTLSGGTLSVDNQQALKIRAPGGLSLKDIPSVLVSNGSLDLWSEKDMESTSMTSLHVSGASRLKLEAGGRLNWLGGLATFTDEALVEWSMVGKTIDIKDERTALYFWQPGHYTLGDGRTSAISITGGVDWNPKRDRANGTPTIMTMRAGEHISIHIPARETMELLGGTQDSWTMEGLINEIRFDNNTIKNYGIGLDRSSLVMGKAGITKRNVIDASKRECAIVFGRHHQIARFGHLVMRADEINEIKAKQFLSTFSNDRVEKGSLTMVAPTNLITMERSFNQALVVEKPNAPAHELEVKIGDDDGVTAQNILHSLGKAPLDSAVQVTHGQSVTLTASQANVVVGENLGIRTRADNRKGAQPNIHMKAPRNVIKGSQSAVFIANQTPEQEPSLVIEGGVNIEGDKYAFNLLNGNAHVTTTHVDKPLTLTRPVPGLTVPEKNTIVGDILLIQGTLTIRPKDPKVDGGLVIKSPRMVNTAGWLDVGLGPESTLMGATTFVAIYNKHLPGQTHTITLHTPTSTWLVMQDEKTPVDITPMVKKFVNHGKVVLSPQGHGGTVLSVATYDGDGTFVSQVDKEKTKSDLIFMLNNTSANPSRFEVQNGADVNLADGERIPLAYAGGTRLFEENSIAYTKPPEKGALTTSALKVTSRPNEEEKLNYASLDVIPQTLIIPLLTHENKYATNNESQGINALANSEDFTIQKFEVLKSNVGALKPQGLDYATFTNYYLEPTTVDVQVTPEVPTIASMDFDLTIGRMDTLSKRRGALVTTSPVWARASYYDVGRKGSFSIKNHSLEVGYDVMSTPAHCVSVALSGLNGKANIDTLSGEGKAHQMGLHTYYTFWGDEDFYLDAHGFVTLVKDKLHYSAEDGSSFNGKYRHTNVGASLEVGKAFVMGNHRVVPQAQMQLTYLGGAKWVDGVTHYELKSSTSLMGRLGLDYRYRFTTQAGLAWEGALSGNVFYEARGRRDLHAQDLLRSVSVSSSRRGAWSSVALGLTGQLSKTWTVNANLERSWGRNHNRAWEANLGVSFGW